MDPGASLGFLSKGRLRNHDHISLVPSKPVHKIENPVCVLKRNLYGHPLAGLYWEIFLHDIIQAAGFKKVVGWECLFVNPVKHQFISVYVDDFKLAGPAGSLEGTWKSLTEQGLALDPPTPLNDNVYLGCSQHEFTPTESEIAAKTALYQTLVGAGGKGQHLIESVLKIKKNVSATETKEDGSASCEAQVHTIPPVSPDNKIKVRGFYYDMCGHTRQCVDRYL